MSWLNFDWFSWNAEQECDRLDRTVTAIYDGAYKQFESAYKENLDGAEALDDEDVDRSSYEDYLKEEFRENRAALATMTFSLLSKSITLHLKHLLTWLGKRFALGSAVAGKSELDRIVSEYRSRFSIDIESLPHFATVREVVLARNSILHNGGQPIADYMEQTQARFLDEAGQINLTAELLSTATGELKVYLTALGQALKDMATAKEAAQAHLGQQD